MSRYLVLFAFVLLHHTPGLSETKGKVVKSAPLSSIATYPLRSAPARVLGLNEPAISAQLDARLEQLVPLVGKRVQANEVLARLDCREFELKKRSAKAQLASVEARRKLAEHELKRAETLVRDKLLSQRELDTRSAELESLAADRTAAAAALDLAGLQVERCTIRAPFAAVVTERSANEGQLLSPGTPVVKLLELDRLEITAQIGAEDADRITGDTKFELDANGERYPLELRDIVNAFDSTTRSRDARFVFAGKPALAGSAGKVLWRDPRPHIPADLLVERDGRMGILIVRDNSSVFVPISGAQPGRNNPVELPLDTWIVIDGYLGLSDGEPVITSR